MRRLFMLMFVANIALMLISLVVLPARVATHFGSGGMANGWAPNHVNAILMTGLDILIFCAIYFSPRSVRWRTAKLMNLPNKEYWLSPANLPLTTEKLQGFVWQFGVAIFLFFLVLGVLTIQANLAKPVRLNLRLFFAAFGCFLTYIIVWTIKYYRAFRVPRGKRGANGTLENITR